MFDIVHARARILAKSEYSYVRKTFSDFFEIIMKLSWLDGLIHVFCCNFSYTCFRLIMNVAGEHSNHMHSVHTTCSHHKHVACTSALI